MSTVLVADDAADQLKRLPPKIAARVFREIDLLAIDPVSRSHLLRMTDYGTDLYVLRVGDYRIIYSINRETETVTVMTVVHRSVVAYGSAPR